MCKFSNVRLKSRIERKGLNKGRKRAKREKTKISRHTRAMRDEAQGARRLAVNFGNSLIELAPPEVMFAPRGWPIMEKDFHGKVCKIKRSSKSV